MDETGTAPRMDEILAELRKGSAYEDWVRERRIGRAFMAAGCVLMALAGIVAPLLGWAARGPTRLALHVGIAPLALVGVIVVVCALAYGAFRLLSRSRKVVTPLFPVPKAFSLLFGVLMFVTGVAGAWSWIVHGRFMIPALPLLLAEFGFLLILEGAYGHDRKHVRFGIAVAGTGLLLPVLPVAGFLSGILLPVALGVLALVGYGALRYTAPPREAFL